MTIVSTQVNSVGYGAGEDKRRDRGDKGGGERSGIALLDANTTY